MDTEAQAQIAARLDAIIALLVELRDQINTFADLRDKLDTLAEQLGVELN